MTAKNEYMQQVMAEQADLEMKLKRRPRKAMIHANRLTPSNVSPAEDYQGGAETPAVDVRITGFWRWQNVIVPPNAYVVHTRRGRDEPLHCGLGTSFRFNPITDSYLVVPAAMQTIMINANCICAEKQGILVQGYVQWVIDDFDTAYRRLDFSDPVDPMRVVNLQLREQAEAVIKDTVATMTLDNVLSDRQPIIAELTARLRNIMEGEGDDEGLGLRIVTVQIKEAVVSSPTLWETLQRPFRAERSKEARLAELRQQSIIAEREAEAEAASFDREQAESARRAKVEAERLAESLQHEKEAAATRAELERLAIEHANAADKLRFDASNERALAEIETDRARASVANDLSPERLKQLLIEALPEIAERMPTPTEMKSVSINGVDGLSTLVPALLELIGRVDGRPAKVDN